MEPRIGQSVEECKANYRASNAKATQACQSGQTFQQSSAEQCLNELTTMTCAEFKTSPTGPAACKQICSSGGQAVPACEKPNPEPAAIDLPDGGQLPLYQEANGTISGSETDTFTIHLDCMPGYGYQVLVTTSSQDLDIALSYDLAGHHSDDNQNGPGSGEGSTLVANSKLVLPTDLVVGVSAVGGTTGDYKIVVNPGP